MDALYDILNGREQWREWGLAPESKVLLVGHSNGGQGAWYNAARNPDRLVGGLSLSDKRCLRPCSHHALQSCPRLHTSSRRHMSHGHYRGKLQEQFIACVVASERHVCPRSAHYIDPTVRAILDSSLTPDDNDLFLSNLVDTPVLGIHGCVLQT